MQYLTVPQIVVVLQQLEPEFVTGISLEHSDVTSSGLHALCPVLKPFTNLTALHLAGSGMNITETGQQLGNEVASALESLPRLQRLGLHAIWMPGSMSVVLGRISHLLSMLRLYCCELQRDDLLWLSTAKVSSRLEQLDVGDNDVSQHVDVLCSLLLHAADSLAIFEAENSDLSSETLGMLLATFRHLPQLRYVDICGSDDIGGAAILKTHEKLISVPHLRMLRLRLSALHNRRTRGWRDSLVVSVLD